MFDVGLVHKSEVVKISLLFLGLLCQDVAVVSMLSFQLTCSGKGEPFFGTGISFYFWHFLLLFDVYNVRQRDTITLRASLLLSECQKSSPSIVGILYSPFFSCLADALSVILFS